MKMLVWVLLFLAAVLPGALNAQDSTLFTGGFLERIRRESQSVPGVLPTAVHVLVVNEFPGRLSAYVDGAPDSAVQSVVAVFQIRYPDEWIIVDAAGDSATLPRNGRFLVTAWDSTRAALLGARAVVVTHEHHDHIGGLIVTPDSIDVARRALLTQEQLETLRSAPNRAGIRFDDARASRFQTVSYDDVFVLAPGVVLIKAAGHTPGSQMIYVRTAADVELVLAGDVAWYTLGIDEARQKPAAASSNVANLGVAEDRERIAMQLHGLRTILEAGVHGGCCAR